MLTRSQWRCAQKLVKARHYLGTYLNSSLGDIRAHAAGIAEAIRGIAMPKLRGAVHTHMGYLVLRQSSQTKKETGK
jgi:hypothetical protein